MLGLPIFTHHVVGCPRNCFTPCVPGKPRYGIPIHYEPRMQRQSLPTKHANTKLLLTQQTTNFDCYHVETPKESNGSDCLGSRPVFCSAYWVLYGIFDSTQCCEHFMKMHPEPRFSTQLFAIYLNEVMTAGHTNTTVVSATRSMSVHTAMNWSNSVHNSEFSTMHTHSPCYNACSWCGTPLLDSAISYPPNSTQTRFDHVSCILARKDMEIKINAYVFSLR